MTGAGGVLTVDDLDEVGHRAFQAEDPLALAAEVVAAVEEGRLADPADTGYALSIAAEIVERTGGLAAAAELAGRAARAAGDGGKAFGGYARALHGELLLRLGRVDEGMAELIALRPLLTEDEDAVHYVSDALRGADRSELAVEWLTVALESALAARQELQSRGRGPGYSQAAVMAFVLAQRRHGLRRELDLPYDDHDRMADGLRDALEDRLAAEEDEELRAGTVTVFWPRAEFDKLLLLWPALAGSYGATWDEHRAGVERGLAVLQASGRPGLTVTPGAVGELADLASRHGMDPAGADLHEEYAKYLGEDISGGSWPPGRNERCWCGSDLKYKKCCLPRSR